MSEEDSGLEWAYDLARKRVKALETALQRIANLPLTQGHKKPDPHIRARRIAVIALGGKPHKVKTRK